MFAFGQGMLVRTRRGLQTVRGGIEVSDHEVDTINQLREVLKDLQRKLDSRSHMLAQILPYVEFKTT